VLSADAGDETIAKRDPPLTRSVAAAAVIEPVDATAQQHRAVGLQLRLRVALESEPRPKGLGIPSACRLTARDRRLRAVQAQFDVRVQELGDRIGVLPLNPLAQRVHQPMSFGHAPSFADGQHRGAVADICSARIQQDSPADKSDETETAGRRRLAGVAPEQAAGERAERDDGAARECASDARLAGPVATLLAEG